MVVYTYNLSTLGMMDRFEFKASLGYSVKYSLLKKKQANFKQTHKLVIRVALFY